MRCYKSFDELYIDSEVDNILANNDTIHIKFDSRKKDMMFLIGILFAAGKRIQIDNINDLTIGDFKSFEHMVSYWHRNRVNVKPSNKSTYNSMFLICGCKNQNDKEKIKEFIDKTTKKGIEIKYLSRNTEPDDNIGYKTCETVANAIGDSNIVGLYYNKDNKGVMFELGIAYYFNYINSNRRFAVLNKNELEFDVNDFGDRIVVKMLQEQEHKDALKNIGYQRSRFID